MTPPYRYDRLPLTPATIADLLPDIYKPGDIFKRDDAVRAVIDHHRAKGGVVPDTNITSATKRALAISQGHGIVSATGVYGRWRFLGGTPGTAYAAAGQYEAEGEESMTIGTGTGSVYVYYYPAYRDQARLRGSLQWPHKIGLTKGVVSDRLRDQIRTGMPERPVVALIFRTDNATAIERMLHSVLAARDRKLDAPGVEWFLTNRSEVMELLSLSNG